MTRVIRSTIITRWLGPYNINYYNPLIRALTRVIEMSTIITCWLGSWKLKSNTLFHSFKLAKQNIISPKIFIFSETKKILKYDFHTKHIFDPCEKIKIIFLHISKCNIKRKYFSFIKICINFPYLEEVLKNLKYLAWRIYSSSNIISYIII